MVIAELLAQQETSGNFPWLYPTVSAAVGVGATAVAGVQSRRAARISEAQRLEALAEWELDGGRGEERSIRDVAESSPATVRTPAELAALPPEVAESDVREREIALYIQHQQTGLSQSSSSFWITLALGALGFLIVILGVGVALLSDIDEGVVTGLLGLIPTSASALLYARADSSAKRADAKFERLADNVRRAEGHREALRVANQLPEGAVRNRVRGMVALGNAFPDASSEELRAILDESPTLPAPPALPDGSS